MKAIKRKKSSQQQLALAATNKLNANYKLKYTRNEAVNLKKTVTIRKRKMPNRNSSLSTVATQTRMSMVSIVAATTRMMTTKLNKMNS